LSSCLDVLEHLAVELCRSGYNITSETYEIDMLHSICSFSTKEMKKLLKSAVNLS